jgi:hypothetical protein
MPPKGITVGYRPTAGLLIVAKPEGRDDAMNQLVPLDCSSAADIPSASRLRELVTDAIHETTMCAAAGSST